MLEHVEQASVLEAELGKDWRNSREYLWGYFEDSYKTTLQLKPLNVLPE